MSLSQSTIEYRVRTKARFRAFVAEINARTVCAHCGATKIEWHNPSHVLGTRDIYRVGNLVERTVSIATIQAEIEQCTPLCRRCHMAEDGRLDRLRRETIERNTRVGP